MAHLASPPPPYQPHVYAQVAVMASVVVCLLTAAGVTPSTFSIEAPKYFVFVERTMIIKKLYNF